MSNTKPGLTQTQLCDTTPGVNSYSGYITVPVTGDTYDASIFFWYFEARNNSDKAPTTIYMPGGPGESFLDGASGFPCTVNPDSNSTTLNEWSWNANVNMLYVDMPVQTGYSYTEAKNGTFDTNLKEFSPLGSFKNGTVVPDQKTFIATMSDQSQSRTANTTAQVARQMWQIAQVWFQEFPEWSTTNPQINLWSYSYSGFFGPATVAYFQQQNDLIGNGNSTDENDIALQLGTLGINNGCVDSECRAAADTYDPDGTGAVERVNQACLEAVGLCFGVVQGVYTEVSNRSAFDIALPLPAAFPPAYNLGYYNQRWVQEALGVPVNFTLSADAVVNNFFSTTGDCMIVSKSHLEEVLSAGIRVAMVYGDRDYRCNWMGAENVSLSADYPHSSAFRAAGYAPIATSPSPGSPSHHHMQGGLVRQHDNFSFSRVFEAGHSVAAYQPETVLRIFERAIFGRDIATGETDTLGGGGGASSSYSSQGLADTLGVTNEVGEPVVGPVCFWYDAAEWCDEEQQAALEKNVAVIENYIVVSPAGTYLSTSGNPTSTGGVTVETVAKSGAARGSGRPWGF